MRDIIHASRTDRGTASRLDDADGLRGIDSRFAAFLEKPPRLHSERFPGYAHELNADEFVWNHLKRTVSKSVSEDLSRLMRLLHPPLQQLSQSQKRLWSCIQASDPSWS